MEPEDFLDADMTAAVEKYERMLRENDILYFDSDELEDVIDFYVGDSKLKKALEAIAFARDIYPFNTDFLIRKAQIISMMGDTADALVAIEEAEDMEPYNPDIILVKGEVLDQLERYDEAIQCYE